MRQHAKEFKNEIQKNGRQLDSKIIIKGSELVLGAEDLFSVTPVTNSTLLKSVMKEVDFESKKQIGIGQEVNIKSGVKVNGEYEYIDYGNYSVYKSEYKAETDTYSHICYDKMLKTMIDYTPLDITYPINLREYINAIATKCGLEFADKNSAFANYNTSINEDHFSNGNYTFRDVLDYIAQLVGGWLCINDNDELEIRYPELARNYDKVSGENVSFISNVEDEINTIIVDGKSTQATRSGKNLFNKNATYSYSNVPSSYNTITEKSTGITYSSTYPNGTPFIVFKSVDLTNYVGKTVRMKATTSGSNGGYRLILTNEDLTSRIKKDETYSSDIEISFVVPSIDELGDTKYLGICFMLTGTGNATREYSNVVVTIDNENMTYEDYGVMPSPDYPSEIESVGYENLFNKLMSNYTSFSNTITIDSVSDNSITLTISSTGGPYDAVRYYSVANLVVGKTYTVSANIVGNDNSLIRLVKNNSGEASDILGYVRNNNSFTFTYDGSYNSLGLFLYISHGVKPTEDLTATFSNIQIEEGSQSHPYIPYGKYGIEVKTVGRNIWDEQWELGLYSVANGSKADSTTNIRSKNYISCLPNTNYYLKANVGNRVCFYDKNKNFISIDFDKQNTIFTTPSNCYYMTFNLGSAYGTTYKNDVCLNISDDKNGEYQPHQSNTLVIELNAQLRSLPNGVKDIAYIKNNICYVDRKVGSVVLDGSESWVYASGSVNPFRLNMPNAKIFTSSQNNPPNVFCNQFTPIAWNNTISTGNHYNDTYLVTSVASKVIAFRNKNCSTLKDWKEYLSNQYSSGTSVILDYELAEPYTEEIGEVETLSTFKGVNNVSLVANMQTNMTITYPTEYEELDKHFLKDVNVSFSKKYGAVNSVVFSRGNGSDNIYRKDNMSISRNGLTEIKITGNPFLEGNDRENFIQQLFDKINGLEFYIMDVASTGIMYLELGDLYYFNMIEEKPSLKSGLIKSGMRKAQGSSGGKFLCLLMNDEIKITQGLEESIYSDEPEITETDYKTASITDTSIKNAIIQTNKNSAEILLKVNSDEVVSAINLSPENIKISSAKLDIDAIATFTNSKLAEAGSTIINGANITTGSINCDRLNGGTINGQAIRGGSISIEKGVYYFNMGTSTSNPNCSGLNVGGYGVKAYSDITATGFAITDGDTGKSQSINIYDGHGRVWYLTFTGGILTASEYK